LRHSLFFTFKGKNMATSKTEAQKVADLRKQAQDKSLPQQVRDMADKKANEIEGRSVKKATGIELAKGGMAKKKMAVGGMLPPPATPKTGPTTPAPSKSMADRLSEASSMIKKQQAASTAQPKRLGGMAGQRQAQAAYKQKMAASSAARKTALKARSAPKASTPVFPDKIVNVQRTEMAKGGAVKKAAPKKFAMGGMSSQIPLSEMVRTPTTGTPAVRPERAMVDRARAKMQMQKPQVNVQPTPRGPAPFGDKQVNVQPTPPTMFDKQVNVLPTKPMMAKGGAVKKAAPKKMMYGGAVAKDLPMRGQRTATNMAKGGSATKKAKK
jgi:hypothetical protein